MKPTIKQLLAIGSVVSIVKTWSDTNDINSPTHFVDIEEFVKSDLMNYIDDSIAEELADKLGDVLNVIRKIN